jgi:hypothetical protein
LEVPDVRCLFFDGEERFHVGQDVVLLGLLPLGLRLVALQNVDLFLGSFDSMLSTPPFHGRTSVD